MLCFNYFLHEKIDIGVLETGLGGRLDATNIISPLVSVITSIGFDHCEFLGYTLDEIASFLDFFKGKKLIFFAMKRKRQELSRKTNHV